ncbi:MAG: hypothetical protein AAFN81_34545, partial [Bacteroidota bacterium]
LEKESVKKPVNGLLTLPFQGGRFALDEDLNLVDSGYINNNPIDAPPVRLIRPLKTPPPVGDLNYSELIGNSIPLDEFNPDFHNTLSTGVTSAAGPDVIAVGDNQNWGVLPGLPASSNLAMFTETGHVYIKPEPSLIPKNESLTIGCVVHMESSSNNTVLALSPNPDPAIDDVTVELRYEYTGNVYLRILGQEYLMLTTYPLHSIHSVYIVFEWDEVRELHVVKFYNNGMLIMPAVNPTQEITYSGEIRKVVVGGRSATTPITTGNKIGVGDVVWWRKSINGNHADYLHNRLTNAPFTVDEDGAQIPYTLGMKALHISPAYYQIANPPGFLVDTLITDSGRAIAARMPSIGGGLKVFPKWDDTSVVSDIAVTKATLTDRLTDLAEDKILCLGGAHGAKLSKYMVVEMNYGTMTAVESAEFDLKARFGFNTVVLCKVLGRSTVMGLGYKDAGSATMFEFSLNADYSPN